MRPAPEYDSNGYLIIGNTAINRQWMAASCLRCGEKFIRQRTSEVDMWWHYDFEMMLDKHEKEKHVSK